MKTMKKIVCALMTLVLLLSSVPTVFADEADTKTIDQDAACSLTIWKFDYTNAKKDGVWDEDAFPSTGWQESYVENALVNTNRKGDTDGQNGNALGNGQTSKGYAIAGVEFTYLKAADIVTFENQGTTQVLYGFHKTDAADLLKSIGLESGANRCAEADSLDADRYFYTSDTLNKALAQSLEANSTTVKNALETFIRNGGTAMAPTSEVGKTSAKDLSVGLYLLVETKVPEMVTSTTNPFFVSLPMTTVTGNDNSASQDGGTAWNYDVVVYPKQETGIPTLEKTVREAKADTGKNEGSTSITDGFAHTATGSAGDTMEYQIVSTLPTITSQATALSTYNFYDTLCEGLTYSKDADATVFTPVTMGKSCGHIMVKGLEEDTYTITEIQTANGYTLLKNAITVTISLKENPAKPCNVYAKDVLGVLQNDPHYAFDGGENLKLANIPQRALSHNYPTASATVDKNDVTMLEDNGSANAEVPLSVKNTKGFDLPKTGDHGTWMYSLVGILLMSTAAGVIVLTVKKKNGR